MWIGASHDANAHLSPRVHTSNSQSVIAATIADPAMDVKHKVDTKQLRCPTGLTMTGQHNKIK